MKRANYIIALIISTLAMFVGIYWLLSAAILFPENVLQQGYQQLAYLGGAIIILLGMLVNVTAYMVNGVTQELRLQRALAEKLG